MIRTHFRRSVCFDTSTHRSDRDAASINPETSAPAPFWLVLSPQSTPDLLVATLSLFSSKISHIGIIEIWCVPFCVWLPVPLMFSRFITLLWISVEWGSVVCTPASVFPSLLRGDLGHLSFYLL